MTPKLPALPDLAVKLEKELEKVAQRLLRNSFKQAGDDDEDKMFPTLARTVRALVGEERWRRSSNQAVIDVVRLAIDGLPEKLSGRSPEQAVGDNQWKGKPERHTAEVLYGYRDEEVPQRFDKGGPELPRNYKGSYAPAARNVVGLSEGGSTWRRIFQVIRQDLVAELLKLTPDDFHTHSSTGVARQESAETTSSAKETNNGHSPTRTEPSGFVARPGLERELESVLEDGKRIIQLTGFWGSGKTYFADLVARRRANAPAGMAWLSVGLHGLGASVVEELEGRGVSTTGMSDALLQRRFRELLVGANAPEVVVFDDVPSYQLIERAIPERPNSLVLITCRKALWPEDGGLRSTIRVRGMRESEAKELLQVHCPVIVNPWRKVRPLVGQEDNPAFTKPHREDWPGMLVDRLGCNPRAVEHAARQLAALPETPVRYLAEECWNNVLNVVDALSSGNSLSDAIRGMLEDLSDNAPARRMLELLSIGLECDRKHFSIYLASYLGLRSGSARVYSRIATQAFQTLVTYNIAWVGQNGRREQVQLDWLVRESARLILTEEVKKAAALSVVDTSLSFLHHAVISAVEKTPEKTEEEVLRVLVTSAPFRTFFDVAWVGYVEEVHDYSLGAFIRYTVKTLHRRLQENPLYRGIEGMFQKGI